MFLQDTLSPNTCFCKTRYHQTHVFARHAITKHMFLQDTLSPNTCFCKTRYHQTHVFARHAITKHMFLQDTLSPNTCFCKTCFCRTYVSLETFTSPQLVRLLFSLTSFDAQNDTLVKAVRTCLARFGIHDCSVHVLLLPLHNLSLLKIIVEFIQHKDDSPINGGKHGGSKE